MPTTLLERIYGKKETPQLGPTPLRIIDLDPSYAPSRAAIDTDLIYAGLYRRQLFNGFSGVLAPAAATNRVGLQFNMPGSSKTVAIVTLAEVIINADREILLSHNASLVVGTTQYWINRFTGLSNGDLVADTTSNVGLSSVNSLTVDWASTRFQYWRSNAANEHRFDVPFVVWPGQTAVMWMSNVVATATTDRIYFNWGWFEEPLSPNVRSR